MNLCMPGCHLLADVCTPPEAVLPGKVSPFHGLAMTIKKLARLSMQTAWVWHWWHAVLCCQHCRKNPSCHNIRICPFLSQKPVQVIIQALVILCYCNVSHSHLPACAIWPLQLIQSVEDQSVFKRPKVSHTEVLFHTQHWHGLKE